MSKYVFIVSIEINTQEEQRIVGHTLHQLLYDLKADANIDVDSATCSIQMRTRKKV